MSNTVFSYFGEFFCAMSGAQAELIRDHSCDADRSTYRARGMLVLALGALVTMLAYFALSTSAPRIVAVLLAALWGILFVCVERLVLMGLMKRRQQRGAKRYLVVAARLLLALGIGLVFAQLVTVVVFKGPILRRLASKNLTELNAARERADSLLSPDVSRTTRERDALMRELVIKDSITADAFRVAEEEGAGHRSPFAGNGPLFTVDTARAHLLDRQSAELRAHHLPLIAATSARLDSLARERTRLVAATANAQRADLADQLQALALLKQERPEIQDMARLFGLLFVALDLLVAVLKASETGRDAYEAHVDSIRLRSIADRDAAADIAVYAAATTTARKKAAVDMIATAVIAAFAKIASGERSTKSLRDSDELIDSIIWLDAQDLLKEAAADRDHRAGAIDAQGSQRQEGDSRRSNSQVTHDRHTIN